MLKPISLAILAVFATTLAGCATQSTISSVESPVSMTQQQAAQVAMPATPTLKRKLALGRITNETSYGKSLLRNVEGDPLGKQVADIFAKALRESNHFTVLERTDITSLEKEAALTGSAFKAVGADVLVIGSITEFGRKTVGKAGFLSTAKTQTAYAKMDVRLVDTRTGVVIASFSGAGEANNASASILGYGSHASYDGTLNDKAISAAINDCVSQIVSKLADRPWQTSFLSLDAGMVSISGGASQGLTKGLELIVKTRGKTVKSKQTGFDVELPGKEIARIRVTDTFGNTPETEGSVVEVIHGSLAGQHIDNLIVEAR